MENNEHESTQADCGHIHLPGSGSGLYYFPDSHRLAFVHLLEG